MLATALYLASVRPAALAAVSTLPPTGVTDPGYSPPLDRP